MLCMKAGKNAPIVTLRRTIVCLSACLMVFVVVVLLYFFVVFYGYQNNMGHASQNLHMCIRGHKLEEEE